MKKSDKGWFKDFMKLLNRNINNLKNDKTYKTAKDILNINDDSEDVINKSMFDYSNDKREDTKEQNALISKTKRIGKNMLKTDKNGYSNYERLYNSLSHHPKFKAFFEQNEIKKGDMLDFGEHIAGFKTKSMEQHEKHNAKQRAEKQAMKQENETLKGENKEKTKKIDDLRKYTNKVRRDRAKLHFENEKLKEEMEKIEKQKEKDKEEYDKAMKDLQEKTHLEIKARKKELKAKYEQAKKGRNEEEIAELEAARKIEVAQLKQQIDDERKRHEEEINKTYAEIQQKRINDLAALKNKLEERHEKEMEEKLEEFQTNQKEIYGFAPNLEAYIKTKLASKAYSLDEDELIDKIARDIGKPGGLPAGTDPKQVAKAIYDRGAEETLKHIKKIANLALLTGYNNDLYNKLPGDVAQEVQKYITDKINDDIRKKNIKYILPKDKPRWEYAMQNKQLNPMLGRSAWRVN